MEIASPGTFDDMVRHHEDCEGYQCVSDLEEWTRQYIEKGYREIDQIFQDDLNMTQRFDKTSRDLGETTDIAKAIDRDAKKLAEDTELWRALRPPRHSKGDAVNLYQRLLDKKVGNTIYGTRIPHIPFSTSADPLLAASRFGRYTAAGGEKRLGIIIKIKAPKGTPVVITNPEQAEYIIGSGHVMRIERIESNVRVKMRHFQNNDGTPGRVEELVADRVIDATLERLPRPKGL